MDTLVIHRLPLGQPDVYDPLTYIQQRLTSGTETILLADRNIFTRWLALMNGAAAGPEHRIVAAVTAFAQRGDIIIEPSLALYEAAATAGRDAANKELRQFRIADNLEPVYWADVALSRAATLSPTRQPTPPRVGQVDFEMPLRSWRRNYVLSLKMAELALRGATE